MDHHSTMCPQKRATCYNIVHHI